MKFKPFKRTPLLLAVAVLAFVCGLQLAGLDFFERLERMTYDLRVRAAQKFPAPASTNLAFVAMQDSSIAAIRHGLLGRPYGLYWPRHIYGRVVEELFAQGAKTVAFDVLFGELRPDHAPVLMSDGGLVESDEYLALQMQRGSNVISAFTAAVTPPDLFTTNSLALGDISTERDSDGVLRRIKSFELKWHPAFKSAERQMDINLDQARVEPDKIVLTLPSGTNVTVALDHDGNFDLADFVGGQIPKGWKRFNKPFDRVWDLGIVLAAQELKLDLNHANVDLPRGKIILRGANGVERVIPVDDHGFFYINWQLTAADPRLTRTPIEDLLKQNLQRLQGETNDLQNLFRGKLVVIGSSAQGNDLSDHGATPLENDTLLVSKHWNVANSIITGQFIRRASLPLELALIVLLGALAAFLTWQLRAFVAAGAVLLLAALYTALAFFAFIQYRFWLPLVFPIACAMLIEFVTVLAYCVVFEEAQKRHVKSVFSKIVAPDIVDELLQGERLALGGARREITVYFADVRGFTEFTDQSQAKVLEYVRAHGLSGAEAENAIAGEAHETLATVNLYLGAIADTIKRHNGTLDKYIGDCAMAFWGAPTPNLKHAATCVRAAIDAQRAVYKLNLKRVEENQKRELENTMSGAARPKSKLPILMLGTGINTGMATVGLMGSDEHLLNYTVFGREVNLASRLEAVSGRSRIIISEACHSHLLRDDPDLAATCIALPPVKVKGIVAEVKIYEVSWRPPGTSPFDEELFSAKPSEGTSFTGLVQREGR